MGLGRHERCLVGPVLDQSSGPFGTGPFQQTDVIRTEARKKGQEVSPGEHVDGVDLEQADPVDHALNLPHRDARQGPLPSETLCGQGDPAGRP